MLFLLGFLSKMLVDVATSYLDESMLCKARRVLCCVCPLQNPRVGEAEAMLGEYQLKVHTSSNGSP